MLALDVPDREPGEEGGEGLDAELAAEGGTRLEGVRGHVHPALGNLVECQAGLVADGQIADPGPQFDQTALGMLAVLGLQRPAKLLGTPLDQSVVSSTRFQPIEVLRHPMKHHLSSNFGLRQGLRFHARKLRVTKSGDKSEISGTIVSVKLLF